MAVAEDNTETNESLDTKRIRVLPDSVINKIAAGEVVERPASVVKELVDNALDAGATSIAVSIEEGGRSCIKVVDDGSGMLRDDALLAFERHATSKIRSDADLSSIGSMGFRGEALASIAAVSKVRLRTRSPSAEVGVELRIEAGRVLDVSPYAGNSGTEIEVRALFFNTPARRKFLRQASTEERRVRQWFTHMALAHPAVTLTLSSGRKELLHFAASECFTARAQRIVRGNAADFERRAGPVTFKGRLCHPGTAQSKSTALVTLVNGRVVQDKLLVRAIKDGFKSMLKSSEVPVGVVALQLPAADVDVNVHPQKSEVRFLAPQGVFQLLRDAVASAVAEFKGAVAYSDVKYSGENIRGATEHVPENRVLSGQAEQYTLTPRVADWLLGQSHRRSQPGSEAYVHEIEEPVRHEIVFSQLAYIGQILSCYLVCQHEERLVVIDMHAAHERVNYNLIREQYRAKQVPSQRLLIPVTVELPVIGVDNVLTHDDLLSSFGIEIEPFGEAALIVRAMPAVANRANVETLIKEIALESLRDIAEGRIEECVDCICARLACHSSIRSGKVMKDAEVYALFAEMDRAEVAAACPHGRPVAVSFAAHEIESWFGRDR